MSLQLTRASVITLKTFPYILLRLGVYFLFALGLILYFSLVYALGQMAASLHDNARGIVWLVGLLVSFPITRLVREYILYALKAGHIAVITELAVHGKLPEGKGQIQWGREQVTQAFKEVSVLFVLDRLVVGVIRSIHRMMNVMGSAFSIVPGFKGLVNFANLILNFSLTYVDEAILARHFQMKEVNAWRSAQDGLILYAQNWKEILKSAFILGVAALLSYAVLFVLFLIPLLGLGAFYPHLKFLFVLAAFFFAAATKLALFDPWALTHMIVVYLTVTEGQVPDPSWQGKLHTFSKKFKKIEDKALAV